MRTKTLMVICMALLVSFGLSLADEPIGGAGSLGVRAGAGGSVNIERKSIPGWSERPVIVHDVISVDRNPGAAVSGSAGPITDGARGGLGLREDPDKQGFPAGWNTNSQSPILKTNPNGQQLIELGESQEPLVLSRIIDLRENRIENVKLNYTSSAHARLRIFVLNSQNALTTGIIEEELLQGSNQGLTVGLSIPDNASRLLIVIEKESLGSFSLQGVSLEVGDSNEN